MTDIEGLFPHFWRAKGLTGFSIDRQRWRIVIYLDPAMDARAVIRPLRAMLKAAGLKWSIQPRSLHRFRAPAPFAEEGVAVMACHRSHTVPADDDFRPGCSINTQATTSTGEIRRCHPGSAGALVVANGRTWLLTANHVASDNGRVSESFTISTDGVFVTRHRKLIGREVRFIELRSRPFENLVDACLCALDGSLAPVQPLFPHQGWQPVSTAHASPRLGARVRIMSRINGERTATIVEPSFNADPGMDVGDVEDPLFRDVILVQSESRDFVTPGDSGSLVMSDNNGGGTAPLGIVFAISNGPGQRQHAVVSSIANIVSEFRSQHNIEIQSILV